jgi:hypothetical protein
MELEKMADHIEIVPRERGKRTCYVAAELEVLG